MPHTIARFTERMDRLYEYDREPVTEAQLKPGRAFAGMYAGEHVAGTEFVIGAFFVLHGVPFVELLLGLLLGNLLAVLSWAFICAPIAVRTRLTLYWYLRRIAGPGLTLLYNIAVALLYCMLAGSMIAVSASAVGVPFNIPMPQLSDVYPNSVQWVVVALLIGAGFTAIATAGFEKLSRFAGVCSPWIFTAFFAGAVASLPALGVHPNLDNLFEVLRTQVWNGRPVPGQAQFSFLHILFFAWFANLAMHVGLSDMAILRYAKNWKAGFWSAIGMYPGHGLAWLCSGIMVAAIGRDMNPGLMAYSAVGLGGVLAVLLAGWTTANPTLYRAGLALQTITPGWPRWKVTLLAGAITSIVACFPLLVMRLLDFVALYGLILMPIGAIVFTEHWIVPRLGLESFLAEKRGWMVSPTALGVWISTLALCWSLVNVAGMHLYFVWLPGYLFALALYTALQMVVARPSVANHARSEVSS